MKYGSKQTFVVHYLPHQMKEHQRIFLLGHGYYRSSAGVLHQALPSYPGYNLLTCFYPTASETWSAHK
jgi:hypothetical protein